jgi:hypothetical protein
MKIPLLQQILRSNSLAADPDLIQDGSRFACRPGPDSANAMQSSGNKLINLRS